MDRKKSKEIYAKMTKEQRQKTAAKSSKKVAARKEECAKKECK